MEMLCVAPGLFLVPDPGDKKRYFLLLNGVSGYLQFRDAELNTISRNVDRIQFDVFPLSGGNTGLPTGCPTLSDGVWQSVDFSFSGSLQELGRNGSDFFHGYIANLVLHDGEIIYSNPLNSVLSSNQFVNRIPTPEV